MQYHRIPLADGAGNSRRRLQLAIQITHSLLITKTSCLVACSAGLSRSPVIAAAALCCLKTQPHRPDFDNAEADLSDDSDSNPVRIQMNQILQEMANSHRLDINPAFLNDVIKVI